MKQTAVEWLVETLNKSIGLTKFVDTCDEEYKQYILGIIEKAKEMEKDQIIESHEEGFYSPPFRKSRRGEAEQYYNETFKSE